MEGSDTKKKNTPPPPKKDADKKAPPPKIVSIPNAPSLAQQLGLGIRRIVIDPGHGGKDDAVTCLGPGSHRTRQLNLYPQLIHRVAHQHTHNLFHRLIHRPINTILFIFNRL